jgi:hypothetical protein
MLAGFDTIANELTVTVKIRAIAAAHLLIAQDHNPAGLNR